MQVPSKNEMDDLDQKARDAAAKAFKAGRYTIEIERVEFNRAKKNGKGYTRARCIILDPATLEVVGRGSHLLSSGHEVPDQWAESDGIAGWGSPINKHGVPDWRNVNRILASAGLEGIPVGDYPEDEGIRNLEGVRFTAEVTPKAETYEGNTQVILDIRPLINGHTS